ncbi:DUF3077 domain-containing protein [Bordetella hinzii]|uniref:DUF3077 domain-containing protein n=1 Tax=Bordetella hinzii TaxID=103855 RepID=UPI000764B967|nr:DUF3077 domain-containing protein [Bordetella hinzii]KXA71070.1 hypothetical protein AXA74_20420 [Bordetella hinzii LMG 13501]VEH23179.1 Protein of uncharacterised function (DUF3077) [Bordetella hinzii]
MKDVYTSEVPFLACGTAGHLFAVRAGVPNDEALAYAADFLGAARDLMLVAGEVDSDTAATAALWLVEMAVAALAAAGVQGSEVRRE